MLYSSRENNSSNNSSNCTDNNGGDAGTSKSTGDIPASNSNDNNENNKDNASIDVNSSNSSAMIGTSNVSCNTTGTDAVGITNLADYLSKDTEVVSAVQNAAPPDFALSVLESSLLRQQLGCSDFCYSKGYDIDKDETFMTWKTLKNVTKSSAAGLVDKVTTNELEVDVSFTMSSLPDVSMSSGVDLDLSVSELIFHDTTHQTVTTEEPGCSDVGLLSTPRYNFGNKSYPGDADSDVLPYPELISRKKKTTSKKQKFFILTSEEAQAAKHQEKRDKEDREANKKSRQEARLKKKQESMKRKSEQAKKRAEKENPTERKNCERSKCRTSNVVRAGQSKKNVDTTPCGTCLVRYCDDPTEHSWIQCQECDMWFHNACQGLKDDGPQTFVCIACDQ